MLLNDAVTLLASGGGFSNPLSSVSTSLSSKSSILSASTLPSVKAAGDNLTILVQLANTYVNTVLGQMKTLLPIQKAANNIYNELNSTIGQQTFFSNTFAPLTASLTPLQNLDSAFTLAQATDIASVVAPANLSPSQSTILTSILVATASASATIAPIGPASDAAIAYGNSLLSGYSYAKFMTQPQPDYVQSVIGASTNFTIGP